VKIFEINKYCRLCNSAKLEKVVQIGDTPVSEKYSDSKNQKPKDSLVPLDLYYCLECGHVQIIHVVNPDFLWDKFTFKTSRNLKISQHYQNYVHDLVKFSGSEEKNFVIDVGSNDGTLLNIFKNNGFKKVLGVDPAKEIAETATRNGIETIVGYFDTKIANQIKDRFGLADFVTANNVYAHINNMDEVTEAIKTVLSKKGIFSFEVSYLPDVIEKKLLGTIFHEHLSYHSIRPLIKFFEKKELEIINVKRNDLQGGSIVCYVQKKGGGFNINKSVKEILIYEEKCKINDLKTFQNFSQELYLLKTELNNLLDKLNKDDKKVAGFGSARSATTLIKFLDIGNKFKFIVDDNKDKHYKFTPGSRIEVLPTDKIYEEKIDYLIVFAWEHFKKIIKKNEKFSKNGGKFINLFPSIEII
tara:strand:+ start:226 stop:1467 length:1242 start_codon:yes stop_codon:yes gene_type:complete